MSSRSCGFCVADPCMVCDLINLIMHRSSAFLGFEKDPFYSYSTWYISVLIYEVIIQTIIIYCDACSKHMTTSLGRLKSTCICAKHAVKSQNNFNTTRTYQVRRSIIAVHNNSSNNLVAT